MKISLITATHERPSKLKHILLPSILAQTRKDFEWIVINDGGNWETQEIIAANSVFIEIKYLQTHHIGLCAARNLGLEIARGDLVGFIDDDNSIYAAFVEKMIHFFQDNPTIYMGTPIQDRRRDVYQNGKLVKRGRNFIGPLLGASNEDFVKDQAMFDSNGFIHKRNDKLRFNEKLLILSDYEYLLRCFSEFGLGTFLINNEHLVEYIQTNEGIIGHSNYQQWLEELEYIWESRAEYKIFSVVEPNSWLPGKIENLKIKVRNNETLTGFSI